MTSNESRAAGNQYCSHIFSLSPSDITASVQ
jgi:hypothetical protein